METSQSPNPNKPHAGWGLQNWWVLAILMLAVVPNIVSIVTVTMLARQMPALASNHVEQEQERVVQACPFYLESHPHTHTAQTRLHVTTVKVNTWIFVEDVIRQEGLLDFDALEFHGNVAVAAPNGQPQVLLQNAGDCVIVQKTNKDKTTEEVFLIAGPKDDDNVVCKEPVDKEPVDMQGDCHGS